MVRHALIFGGSGGLAGALADELVAQGWKVDVACRSSRRSAVDARYGAQVEAGTVRVLEAGESYAKFVADRRYDAYVFAQALFEPKPLVEMADGRIEQEVAVGLTEPMLLTRSLLKDFPAEVSKRSDFAFIGSTSAYAGFVRTAVYCAVKHGLLGFVRAMNDEYSKSETRFWLFSMGTMKTEMGARLVEQDATSFLQPEDVAKRIVESLSSNTNIFEPEVILRRRTIRFKGE
jgi:3-hydroxybutyrate dehydrogenase